MIPERAIRKAIVDGGYRRRSYRWEGEPEYVKHLPFKEPEQIALDPPFWQALGKALGWENEGVTIMFSDDRRIDEAWGVSRSEYQGIRFGFRVLTGGDLEAFWAELLP